MENVSYWNHCICHIDLSCQCQVVVKTFNIVESPVRSAKFIASKSWFITGSDDYIIRVYNYETGEQVTQWTAHADFIRCLEVHPTLPYIFRLVNIRNTSFCTYCWLSSSDDTTIKAWNWEDNFANVRTYSGHEYYVMQVKVNPKDTNTIASGSLDKTIKFWNITTGDLLFTLSGHEKGINAIDFFPDSSKTLLLSGADDKTIKVWDYEARTCVQTLVGHEGNLSSVKYHPRLPWIVSSSEDATVRYWNSETYELVNTVNYGLERPWSVNTDAQSNKVVVGFDKGIVVVNPL